MASKREIDKCTEREWNAERKEEIERESGKKKTNEKNKYI